MIEKVTAYKVKNALETDPKRAYAWELENISEKHVSFGSALWILDNIETMRKLLEQYESETTNIEIGGNPSPQDVQEKLGEFLDWLDVHYETDQGTTTLYWFLSHEIGKRIKK